MLGLRGAKSKPCDIFTRRRDAMRLSRPGLYLGGLQVEPALDLGGL